MNELIDSMKEVVMSAPTETYEYFVTDIKFGTTAYYTAAMNAGYYGVEDDGRSFRVMK